MEGVIEMKENFLLAFKLSVIMAYLYGNEHDSIKNKR